MYSWNLLNKEFREKFQSYDTGNPAERIRFEKILRVHDIKME